MGQNTDLIYFIIIYCVPVCVAGRKACTVCAIDAGNFEMEDDHAKYQLFGKVYKRGADV